MQKPKPLLDVHNLCLVEGYLKPIKEVDLDLARTLHENAEINLHSAQLIAKNITPQQKEWLNVYTLHYEAFRIFAEALLLFGKITSSNHQCTFAALCHYFPQLEFDWNFIEQVRIKRHGVNYYGQRLTYSDWKSIELQLNLYISALKKEIEKNLK